MTKPGGNDFDILMGADEQRGGGVPQAVEGDHGQRRIGMALVILSDQRLQGVVGSILISSHPNYMMAYGACTYIEQASGLWVTSQTSRLLRSYVEHHPDRRMVELQAHPLAIPDKVDSWLVATVC